MTPPVRLTGPAVWRAPHLLLLLAISACLGDPVGPGVIRVAVDGATLDTVWIGAPGESLSSPVRVRVMDEAGTAIPRVSVVWTAVGLNAQVVAPAAVTNRAGEATARWVLGTDATEEQQLHLTVLFPGHESHLVVRAQAVPHIVTALRVVLDTPAVVRLGDTLPVRVDAIDPYGNPFPAPDFTVAVADSAVGSVVGSGIVGGPKRGRLVVHVSASGVAAQFPMQVTQYVATIVPAADVIQLSALGAEVPVVYVVRDDRGRIVADTIAAIVAADAGVVQVVGNQVRAVAPGITSLRLTLGSAAATVIAGVQQRVGSLRLVRDTIRLDALMDTTSVVPVAHDSLGAPIAAPALSYDVSDRQVATFSAGRTLEAVNPGAAVVTVRDSVSGISTSAPVVVRQRVAAIEVTPTQVRFDALFEAISLSATARDRLGSVVPGVALDYSISDTAVAVLESGAQLLSVAPGRAVLTVRDPETGTVGTAPVSVEQVATRLNVAVTFGSPIVTMPAGASLPLTCQAFDKNGFEVAQEPLLVGSVKGTVGGAGCSDARIVHSGYDTLRFALGTAQARVPVTVSTGDSVSVVAAAQPLTDVERIRFVGEDLANPSILALRPLVQDILAAYGNPASNLGRAGALRDWLARTAIHPQASLHPDGSTRNLSVLPTGTTWADVNALPWLKTFEDRDYWWSVGYDGYAMLNRLLGTLDPSTGRRADDGLMVHVDGVRYGIRDIESYRYALCTFQDVMLNVLWAAAGLHGMLISTVDHDAAAVFIPELGRWAYEDPTYNEEYVLDGTGEPLSPADLLTVSSVGEAGQLRAVKRTGPSFDPQSYIDGATYINSGHPNGMVIMGSQLHNRAVGMPGWSVLLVQINVPRLDAEWPFNDPVTYARVTSTEAFPTLGPFVQDLRLDDSVYVVQLSTTFPNHERFERRLKGGTWETVPNLDVLPVGACRVEYRSVDAVGSISASAVLDVWAPRTEEFVRSALLGSVRGRAPHCVSP